MMRSPETRFAVLLGLVLTLACGQKPVPRPVESPAAAPPEARGEPAQFVIECPTFADHDPIPERYAGSGENKSPPLTWRGAPANTAGFALIVEDPDAPNGVFLHWLMYNIPAAARSLAEGQPRTEMLADGSRQGPNDARRIGYDGPRPPPGRLHHYHFRLLALDRVLEPKTPNRAGVEAAMAGHVLAQTELVGTYER